MAIFSSGSDWLTLTNVVDDESDIRPLARVFDDLTGVSTRWTAGGYKGSVDPDSGIKYGSRLRKDARADEILICPGRTSDMAIEEIPDPLAYRVTRLDLQVTVTLDDYDENIASDLYDGIMTSKEQKRTILGRRKLALLKSSTGQTLYVGSRKSGRKFFRVYDKSNDVGAGLGTIWRQEVQYGRYLAQEALERYLSIMGDGYGVIGLVCAEFQDALWWSLHDHIGDLPEIITEDEKPLPTLSSKLYWLETCVRPTITLMIDNDLEEEMLSALGLRGWWERRWDTIYKKVVLDKIYDEE